MALLGGNPTIEPDVPICAVLVAIFIAAGAAHMGMFRANITRDEANARSAQLHVESYEVVVDLTGRRPDGTPLADGAATFTSTTTVRFGSIACVTSLTASSLDSRFGA